MIPAPADRPRAKISRWYRARVLELFKSVDVIVARLPLRRAQTGQAPSCSTASSFRCAPISASHTQPNFVHRAFPVVAVRSRCSRLPIGVQIIAAPWREDHRAAASASALERAGVVSAARPRGL